MKNPPDYGDYNISGPGKFRNLKIDAIPKDSIKKGRVVTYQSPTMNLKACSSIAAAAASEPWSCRVGDWNWALAAVCTMGKTRRRRLALLSVNDGHACRWARPGILA